MSVINQLKEKRNHLVAQATLLVSADMNAETRAKIDAMYADADALKGDIDRAERSAAMEAELRESKPLPSSPLAQVSDVKSAEVRMAEHKAALRSYLLNGESEMPVEQRNILRAIQAEKRTQNASTGALGGFTVATDLSSEIEIGLKWYGGMRKVARSIVTGGFGNLDWPTLNDTANPGKRLNATTVPGTADELDLTFGQVVFGNWTYTTEAITVQKELIEDSAFPIDQIIKDAFIERIGRAQNTDFTIGSGTTMPNGVVPQSTTGVTAATGGATTVSYANLVDLVHSVDIAYRGQSSFMFHDTTLAALRKLVDTQNRPLFGLGINGGDPDKILGYSYQVNNDVAQMAANAKSILFGNFNKYIIRDFTSGYNVLRLNEIAALQNQVVFVGFTRADGQLTDPGTHPIKTFVNSAT